MKSSFCFAKNNNWHNLSSMLVQILIVKIIEIEQKGQLVIFMQAVFLNTNGLVSTAAHFQKAAKLANETCKINIVTDL